MFQWLCTAFHSTIQDSLKGRTWLFFWKLICNSSGSFSFLQKCSRSSCWREQPKSLIQRLLRIRTLLVKTVKDIYFETYYHSYIRLIDISPTYLLKLQYDLLFEEAIIFGIIQTLNFVCFEKFCWSQWSMIKAILKIIRLIFTRTKCLSFSSKITNISPETTFLGNSNCLYKSTFRLYFYKISLYFINFFAILTTVSWKTIMWLQLHKSQICIII